MAGIALKSQCDFVSIMVPPEVSLKEKNVRQKKDVNFNSIFQHPLFKAFFNYMTKIDISMSLFIAAINLCCLHSGFQVNLLFFRRI